MTTNSHFFEDLEVGTITVVSGVRVRGRAAEHTHGRIRCGIFYIHEGEAQFYKQGSATLTVRSGETVFIPHHLRYRMEFTAEKTSFVTLNLDLHGRDGEPRSVPNDITVLARSDPDGIISRIMTGFELCGPQSDIGSALRKKELIYRLFGAVYSMSGEDGHRNGIGTQIARGVRLLERTYLENLPISVMADECRIHVNTFRLLFHKYFGTSPVKYRNALRMQRARELLEDGSFTVQEVAYSCGFENVGYFCRYYRSVTGEAPGDTKKRGLPSM